MYAELGLSDAQKAKMEAIQEGSRSRMEAMRAEMRNGSTDRNAMRSKMEEVRKAELVEVKKILTADQFTKYEKMLAERRSRGGQRGGRGGGGRGGM